MNDSYLQELVQGQSDGVSSSVSDSIGKTLEPLMPIITTLIAVSVILTIVLLIAFIINIVQKHRTHTAILRIDRNLQLLVDAQLGKSAGTTSSVEPVSIQEPKE